MSSSSFYNRDSINQMYGGMDLYPNTTTTSYNTTTTTVPAASPIPTRTSSSTGQNNGNVYFTPPYGYSVDPSINNLFTESYNSRYKNTNDTMYNSGGVGNGSYRNLSEANAMLTAACSNLLEALQNPNNRYQKDQCIEDACNAIIAGQQVQSGCCSDNNIQQVLPCTLSSSNSTSFLNSTLSPWNNNSRQSASKATSKASHNNSVARTQGGSDGIRYHTIGVNGDTLTGQHMLINSSSKSCNSIIPSPMDNNTNNHSTITKHHHGNLESSRLPICYESSPSTSTSTGGQQHQQAATAGGRCSSSSSSSPRRKAYGAPTGVWKNPYGFVSTIYVNKRRVYGPLRKSIEAATRDREALLSVKDIITTVEDMRLFVKDVLKPNTDGGVAYDDNNNQCISDEYTYKKNSKQHSSQTPSSLSSVSIVDIALNDNNHIGRGGTPPQQQQALGDDNGGMFITL